MNYINHNLGMWVGSDYVIGKAKKYVKSVEKWKNLHTQLAPLVGRAIRLDYNISWAQMEAAYWKKRLENCLQQ